MLKSWINYFEKELRGTFVESKEVNAVGKNRIERDALYSNKEKKELRPNQACMNMYAKSNRDAEKAVRYCSGLGGRVLVPVDVTADALLDAILKQVTSAPSKILPSTRRPPAKTVQVLCILLIFKIIKLVHIGRPIAVVCNIK